MYTIHAKDQAIQNFSMAEAPPLSEELLAVGSWWRRESYSLLGK